MTVFANGLEVSCKAQNNKVIAAFPDVCFTPPENPATPPGVLVPYPSFGMDSDTAKGTGTVKIGGKTISQKNKSYCTKTTGTEAGCAAKKGAITSKNTGKKYANAWSGNVKAEGEPISRFSDICTNNHASPGGNTLTFPNIGGAGVHTSTDDCLVGEYSAIVSTCNDAGGEAHHIIPDKCFRTGNRAQAKDATKRIANAPTLKSGMCICLSSDDHDAIHEHERAATDSIGKAGTEGLKGKALKTQKDALKKIGEWGTGDITEVYEAIQETLWELEGVDEECIQAAIEATDDQWAEFDDGQTVRTSNTLPNAAAKKKMIP